MNERRKGLFVLFIGLMLSLTTISATLATVEHTEDKWILVTDIPQETSFSIRQQTPTFMLQQNNQVTYDELNEGQPSVDIDHAGNPFLLYQIVEDFGLSTIGMRRSPDGSASWPDDQAYLWELQDVGAINPDISFMEDGIRAFATNELIAQEPTAYLHDYVDIEDSSTWTLYSFDFSSTSNYCAETAITTNGTSIVALASITDYHSGEYDLDDTIKINWNVNSGDGDWPGVFWINEDAEGNSEPRSHVCADSGEKIFFVYQEDGVDVNSRILTSYCKVDENTEYTDWTTSNVAIGNDYDCTYPDVSVTGKTAYVVYMCNKDGNQDIYIAKSTNGRFWTRNAITTSPTDEMYPVVSASGDKVTVMFIKDNNLYQVSSDDGASTWTEPAQVNEVDGSVDATYQSMDIYGASTGFWTDNRNGNLDIFTDNVADAPLVRIDEVSGGFGVSAAISNVGTAAAEDISWSINIDGGFMLVGSSKSDTITLEPGETASISTGLIFGFGNVNINVVVDEASKDATGFCLGPFMLKVS